MALLDPRQGRRRRARTRDKLAHLRRKLPRQLARYEHRMEGAVQGVIHQAGGGQGRASADELERYVVERVKSELGHAPDIPLGTLNIDAVDGLVYLRGAVRDEELARRIVLAVGVVPGVRGVISLLRAPSGAVVGGTAGEPDIYGGAPRAVINAEAVRRALMNQFPGLTDADILASEGYIHVLAATIAKRTGRPLDEVTRSMEAIVLAVA